MTSQWHIDDFTCQLKCLNSLVSNQVLGTLSDFPAQAPVQGSKKHTPYSKLKKVVF